MALHTHTAPPTINTREIDPEVKIDLVTAPRSIGSGVAISNSFGFGGHNAVAAFRTYEG
jgi:3-oxoacyl-[acyl-carrier-protein] synthase II